MDRQHLFDIFVGIIVTIVGFFAKQFHADNKETQKELSEFKTHVAENYAHNGLIDEIKEAVANANKRLDSIYEILTKAK